MRVVLVFGLLSAVICVPVQETEDTCGYKGCPKIDQNILNVHLVPHTHDDVGWLKTVDQYYYGSRNNIQKAGVQYILDSVIKELWEDPKRRFIYVETAFFWKWWTRQSDAVKQRVHTLVEEGRLQFVGGAWSMNDEAASHYHSIIDQFTWGLQKLKDTFGTCARPRVGWQIDPFGHSREFASLIAAMDFDGLFLGRIDFQDKMARKAAQRMELLWRGDDDLGASSDIFTGVLYNTYSPPPGFCFDVLCQDEPIIDDPDSPMFNVDTKISLFLDYVRHQALFYRTKNVVITMGGDFTYQDANMWYKNLDKLIQYANLKSAKDGLGIKLFYSTPNCYLKAVKEANPQLPIKQDDFFPYASDSTAFWTGYFTSRPTTKYFERQGGAHLQMVKQLQLLAGLDEHNMFVLDEMKSAMGIMQHHDAITGTEKEHVTHDYERLLNQAIEDSTLIARQAFNKVTQDDALKPPLYSYDRCRFNESSCYTSENSERFVVTLYNPVGWKVNETVRIPVMDGIYEVYAPNGDTIKSQLVDIPELVKNIPTRISKATHEIVFIAYLHPFGIKNFYIKQTKKVKRDLRETDGPFTRNTFNFVEYADGVDADGGGDIIAKIDKYKHRYDTITNGDELTRLLSVDVAAADDVENYVVKDEPVESLSEIFVKENEINRELEELERVLKEKKEERRKLKEEIYSHLNVDELRMLADDPMIVEVFEELITMDGGNLKMEFDNSSGEIKSVSIDGKTQNLTIGFFYYPGCVGNNEVPQNRSSGAYIFRPNATQPLKLTPHALNRVKGNVVQEIRVRFGTNVLCTLRLYNELSFIEINWLVGPIDIDDGIGKEYVVKYQTDLISNGEFYTDSNGRQMIKRILNKRGDFNVSLVEPVPGNYYPVTNQIFIETQDSRFTVLTDRSQGGSSLVEGEIELMLHRRLLHDDAFGVDEALNETANNKGLVVRGNHRIVLDKSRVAKKVVEQELQPQIFVSDANNLELDDWFKLTNCHWWIKDLPSDLHILTVEPLNDKLLLRLENLGDTKTGNILEIDLNEIFYFVNVKSFEETNLAANAVKTAKKWHWSTAEAFSQGFNDNYGVASVMKNAGVPRNYNNVKGNGFKVKINPKQIRTFVLDYELVK